MTHAKTWSTGERVILRRGRVSHIVRRVGEYGPGDASTWCGHHLYEQDGPAPEDAAPCATCARRHDRATRTTEKREPGPMTQNPTPDAPGIDHERLRACIIGGRDYNGIRLDGPVAGLVLDLLDDLATAKARAATAEEDCADALAEADTLDPTIDTTPARGTDTSRGGYLPQGAFTHWLAYGETGLSSEAIMRAAIGADIRKDAWTHPSDPGDFRRCVLLLDAVPEARRYMHALADVSAVWAALIENWDDIEKTLAEEVPGFRDRDPRGRAPKTYRLIQAISDQARKPNAATIRREVLGR